MSLSDNPIFLTQKRLVHRGGVLAAVLIAALIGLSLLSGLIAFLANPAIFNFHSLDEAGKVFYAWMLGIEGLILTFGVSLRVSRVLSEDRKAGLWDSNRLTPLKPQQIVAGYWFGPGLREFYMAAALAIIGLMAVIIAKLPITLWLGTQTVVFSTACFMGLLSLLTGLAFEKQQGTLAVIILFFCYPFSFMAAGRGLNNFLLPIYSIVYQFRIDDRDWMTMPKIFGIPFHPIILVLGIQFLIGFFLWRAAVRKTARPALPILQHWEGLAVFIIVAFAQHGLMWDTWRGQYPAISPPVNRFTDDVPFLPVVNGVIIFVALSILAFASPSPELVRVESLRERADNAKLIFSRSALWLALALAMTAGMGVLTQCLFSAAYGMKLVAAVTINLVELFASFVLVIEFCRSRYQRRAGGLITLWLFVLWLLPFIIALVFMNIGFARISLLSPCFFALANDPDWNLIFLTELAHFGIVAVLFGVWLRQWNRLIGKASSPLPPTQIPAAVKN